MPGTAVAMQRQQLEIMRNFSRTQSGKLLSLCFGLTLGGLVAAPATLLEPGDYISLRSAAAPAAALLVADTKHAFEIPGFSGTLISKVWAHDESNPWGGLTFAYRLVHDGECEESFRWLTFGGFAGWLTDVNHSGAGLAARKAQRAATGDTISFGFVDRKGDDLPWDGDKSAWMIIQTDSMTWGANQLVSLDSTEVRAVTFAPVAVPEPAVTGVVLIGLGALWLNRRR